jgi:hypothetical protein
MATSPGKIILKPTPLKVGAEWQIAAQHPSGQIEMICGFKSEIEANEWIKSGSKAWLKKRAMSMGDHRKRPRESGPVVPFEHILET